MLIVTNWNNFSFSFQYTLILIKFTYLQDKSYTSEASSVLNASKITRYLRNWFDTCTGKCARLRQQTAPPVMLNEERIHTNMKTLTLVKTSYMKIGTMLKQFVHAKPSYSFFLRCGKHNWDKTAYVWLASLCKRVNHFSCNFYTNFKDLHILLQRAVHVCYTLKLQSCIPMTIK